MNLKKIFRKWLGVDQIGSSYSFGNYSTTGINVTERRAIQLSTVWACVKLISETIATLPLHVYKTTENGRVKDNKHPLAYIIKDKPNADSDAITFWQANITSILLHGNGINKIIRLNGKMVGLEFIHNDRINVVRTGTSLEFYEVFTDGTRQKIQGNDLFLLKGFSLDGIFGMSAIQRGAEILGSALSATESANTTFKNGLIQAFVFKLDKVLTSAQRAMLKDSVEDIVGTLNSGKPIIAEAGMDVKSISISPKDAQLLESRQYSVEEICRLFGVDPSLIGRAGAVSNWGTGLEQKMSAFLTLTLRPLMVRIEQAINSNLFEDVDKGKYFAEFSVEGLLRADSMSRANYYQTMINAGIMTRDEARAYENLTPKGGNAEKLMVNSATQPIDSLGENKYEQYKRF